MNKSEQLIACLEGEIAKRDEELAACRVAVENCEVFRAEIAAIKAQEPVAWAGVIEDCASLFVTEPQLWKAIPLYAAPVAEAKAQGVVLDGSQLAGLLEQVRLDDDEAKPHGSGAAYWNNAVIACQVAIRDALAAPVQQVSVPDVLREAIKWADHLCFECGALVQTRAPSVHVYNKTFEAVQAAKAMIAAAPAALSHGEQVRDALAELLECPASVVQATVPHAGIEAAPPYQVVLDVSVSLTRWKKARAALEAIAPAAPAADVGIVDMYRHLQKVTPYRFKKIQDASITDGGDVMYFHKDRFDAAVLADMATHCAAKGVM